MKYLVNWRYILPEEMPPSADFGNHFFTDTFITEFPREVFERDWNNGNKLQDFEWFVIQPNIVYEIVSVDDVPTW